MKKNNTPTCPICKRKATRHGMCDPCKEAKRSITAALKADRPDDDTTAEAREIAAREDRFRRMTATLKGRI